MTNYEQIAKALKDTGRPMQRKELKEATGIEDTIVAVIIANMVKKDLLKMWKYQTFPAFYALPIWEESLEHFDPLTKEWKHGIKN